MTNILTNFILWNEIVAVKSSRLATHLKIITSLLQLYNFNLWRDEYIYSISVYTYTYAHVCTQMHQRVCAPFVKKFVCK